MAVKAASKVQTSQRANSETSARIKPKVGAAIIAGLVLLNLAYWLIPWGSSDQGERIAVSGTVTVDGKPMEIGHINFVPVKGTDGPSTGGSIQKGQFEIPQRRGPVVGSYKITVHGEMRKFPLSGDNPQPSDFPPFIRQIKSGEPMHFELSTDQR